MSQNELITTIEELQELRRMQEELESEITAIQDKVKAHMTACGVDTITSGAWKVCYKTITVSRFDTSAFKKAMPDLAAQYTKTTTSSRFTVQ